MTTRFTTSNNIRIIPQLSDYLDRKLGARGEIFYDQATNTLRLYDGVQTGGINLAKADLTNISNAVFLAKASSAGVSGGGSSNASQLTSGTVPVLRLGASGTRDNTTYLRGDNTWAVVTGGSSSNSFATIAVAGQSSVVADSATDTLTLTAGVGITLTTNASTDTITITGTSAANTGNITFAANTIDSADSTAITVTPTVNFESDVVVGNEIVFADGSRQATSAVGVPGPTGPTGPQGASGSGSGDVLSAGGGYIDNRIVRYDGVTGTIIQVSSASISDAGLLTATSFSGSGSLITALNATELTTGTIPDARFPATLPAGSGVNLTALNATQLTSGTIPDARFPATLPAGSGVNLTALNATQLTSGTVPIARIGATGTASASTYLRGDNSWATVSGAVSDSFATIAVAGQSSVVADSSTDTLTLAAGTGISITTNASTDTVTITNTVTAGATAFTGLSDRGNLTVDQFYLPAITMLVVTNSGSAAYRFDQYGTTNNPTIYAMNATTIAFNLQASGHPFLIQDSTGTNYNTGLVHVTTAGVVTTGADAQGKASGTLYWKIPESISSFPNYRYQCSVHGGMVGAITIKSFAGI